MGCLINCETSDLLLRKAKFDGALRALQELAKELPEEFDDPQGILDAKTLAEAFQAAYFEVELDDAGDLIRVTYISDKAPPDSSEQWPDTLFYAIAPSIEEGTIEGSVDDYKWVIDVIKGRVVGSLG
jgi:hypothetical protein